MFPQLYSLEARDPTGSRKGLCCGGLDLSFNCHPDSVFTLTLLQISDAFSEYRETLSISSGLDSKSGSQCFVGIFFLHEPSPLLATDCE